MYKLNNMEILVSAIKQEETVKLISDSERKQLQSRSWTSDYNISSDQLNYNFKLGSIFIVLGRSNNLHQL
jgi:hypothetical protein